MQIRFIEYQESENKEQEVVVELDMLSPPSVGFHFSYEGTMYLIIDVILCQDDAENPNKIYYNVFLE